MKTITVSPQPAEDSFIYSPFHKTLPKSSLQIHLVSVRFYETGDIQFTIHNIVTIFIYVIIKYYNLIYTSFMFTIVSNSIL